MITNHDLEALREAATRATQQAMDAAEDRRRCERTLEMLKRKEETLANEAKRAMNEYQAGIERARRLAS